MNPVVIVQRGHSSRLPEKVLKDLAGRTVLEYVVRRCQQSRSVASVMIATSDRPADDPLQAHATPLGVDCYRGSLDDVLCRYVEAGRRCSADPVIRITADCPLVDPRIIDQVLDLYCRNPADYAVIEGFPRGTGDVEVMRPGGPGTGDGPDDARGNILPRARDDLPDGPSRAIQAIDRAGPARPARRLPAILNEPADLEVVRHVCRHFAPRFDFSLAEILPYLAIHPEIASLNRHVRQKDV